MRAWRSVYGARHLYLPHLYLITHFAASCKQGEAECCKACFVAKLIHGIFAFTTLCNHFWNTRLVLSFTLKSLSLSHRSVLLYSSALSLVSVGHVH